VSVPSSKVKVAIAQVLKDEGYIDGFTGQDRSRQVRAGNRPEVLRWPPGDRAHRACEPSRPARVPRQRCHSPGQNGLGVAIVTTPKGVMTDRKARATGVGGEVLCYVA
jgi:small subunit ribosomal protein S8